MMDMRNTKKKRMIASIIAILIILAMIVTMIIGAFF